MKVVVLMENTAPEGSGLTPEHGLSFYIQYRGRALLLDAGSSGAFADNAAALGVDLAGVEAAVLSHGHYDHADGLRRFFACNAAAPVYARTQAGGPYFSTSQGDPRFIGVHRELWEGCRERFVTGDEVRQIADGAWLVPGPAEAGGCPGCRAGLLRKLGRDQFVPDDFAHEQSLALEGAEGLTLFSSCSHNGIVDIVREAGERLGRPVRTVLGGLHLSSARAASGLNCPPEYPGQVARALLDLGVRQVYTGHCTGPAAYGKLKEVLGEALHPLTTGLILDLEG